MEYFVPTSGEEFVQELEKGRWDAYRHVMALVIAYQYLDDRQQSYADHYVATHETALQKLKNIESNFDNNNTTFNDSRYGEFLWGFAESLYGIRNRAEGQKTELAEKRERQAKLPENKIVRFWQEWRNGRIATPAACVPENIPTGQEGEPLTDACLFALDHVDRVVDAVAFQPESKGQKGIALQCENLSFDSLMRSAYFSAADGANKLHQDTQKEFSLKYQSCVEDYLEQDVTNERL